MLGQKLKNARMPGPIGLGFGSAVQPMRAATMTAMSGPVPSSSPAMPASMSQRPGVRHRGGGGGGDTLGVCHAALPFTPSATSIRSGLGWLA